MLRYRVWYTVLFKKHAIQYFHGNLPKLIGSYPVFWFCIFNGSPQLLTVNYMQ
jgi:hypothetical protein